MIALCEGLDIQQGVWTLGASILWKGGDVTPRLIFGEHLSQAENWGKRKQGNLYQQESAFYKW